MKGWPEESHSAFTAATPSGLRSWAAPLSSPATLSGTPTTTTTRPTRTGPTSAAGPLPPSSSTAEPPPSALLPSTKTTIKLLVHVPRADIVSFAVIDYLASCELKEFIFSISHRLEQFFNAMN